jgi:hypothetical protein
MQTVVKEQENMLTISVIVGAVDSAAIAQTRRD